MATQRPPASVTSMRYRCNLGAWALLGVLILPSVMVIVFGPWLIRLTEVLAG